MSEHDEQVLIFKWARLSEGRWPELALLFAIPNGGHRHKAVAAKLKAEGVRAGVPDMCLPVARGRYHSLYIELKHGRNKATAAQMRWIVELRAVGNCTGVVYEFEGAKALIEDYLREALPGSVYVRQVTEYPQGPGGPHAR